MPSSNAALALTDAYRAALLEQRRRVGVTLRQQWEAIDSEDLDRSYSRWLGAAAAIVAAAQRIGVSLTDTYLARFLSRELDERIGPKRILSDAYANRDPFGRPLSRALLPPLFTVKLTLASRRDPALALAAGLTRALRIASGAVLEAPRRALADEIAGDARIVGWRRVTSTNPCGACLAAATGAVREADEVLETHGHCRCTCEPVIRGVRERVFRPTGEELFDRLTAADQNHLFRGRGGAAKADLIRAGEIDLADLITRQQLVSGGRVITETPLSALTT